MWLFTGTYMVSLGLFSTHYTVLFSNLLPLIHDEVSPVIPLSLRTRAERLHNDMFVFLSDASKVYCDHFSTELQVT